MNYADEFLFKLITEYNNAKNEQVVFKTNQEKAKYISNKLFRKKFRKSKVAEITQKDIFSKVLMSIEQNIPLHFIVCFGGYKHFWNSSYPKVDFAELFNLVFFREYFLPILNVHKPGVVLEYGAEDIVISLMDNFPHKDLIDYAKSFKNLIQTFSKNIPKNLQIKYISTQEKYDGKKLINTILEKLPARRETWNLFTNEEKEENLRRSKRSIKWNGENDWTALNEEERLKKQIDSRLIELLFYENEPDFIGDYYDGANRIPVVLSWGLSFDNMETSWLTLGSTFSSTVDFWTGRGILEKHSNKLIPRIVSHTQYEKIKNKLTSEKIISIELENFKEIEIYDGIINFNK